MKVVQINITCGVGSTGKICQEISKLLTQNNIENYVLYSEFDSNYPNAIKYTNKRQIQFSALVSRIFGNYGFTSKRATKKLINHLEKIKPDIVHIHNIHGHACNFEMLFKYLRDKNIKIYYTFHDCWALTGYCPHFTMAKCEEWVTGCACCNGSKKYSYFFNNSQKLLEKKKRALLNQNLTIITPSEWMASLVKQSYLKDYEIKVINNGIDINLFKPTPSDFRKKHGLEDKFILLGVAFDFGNKKGLDVFIELSKRLDEKYQIVLVGTDKETDKTLPKEIISINRTRNIQELLEIYSCADLFVNPTREDTFPTVNIESLACGTPVITYATGGSPEILDDTCGRVVACDDIDGLEKGIKDICENNLIKKEDCIKRAQMFDKDQKFKEYIQEYLNK